MGTSEPPPTSAPHPPPPPPEEPRLSQLGLYVKLVVLAAVVAYAIAFIVENDRQIHVRFVFGTTQVSLIWEILLVLAVGFLAGVLVPQLHRHRRRTRLRQQARQSGDGGPEVGGGGEAVRKPR